MLYGVDHSVVQGEEYTIREKQPVGTQKIVTEQKFVEKSFFEP